VRIHGGVGTLNLMIVSRWGIWQWSDHRLSEPPPNPAAAPLTDFSIKHLVVRCRDGGALVTYCGLGRLPGSDEQDVSDWLRVQIRGDYGTVDQTCERVRERASVLLAGPAAALNLPTVFLIGAFRGGRPLLIYVSNQDGDQLLDTFYLRRRAVADDEALVAVAGHHQAVSQEHMDLLARVANKKPRKQDDFARLLAEVNAQASRHGRGISKHCVTSYMPPGIDGIQSTSHGWPSGARAVQVPFVALGVDFTESGKLLIDSLLRGAAIAQEELDAAMRRAVTPAS
jgi:hypothetical protein